MSGNTKEAPQPAIRNRLTTIDRCPVCDGQDLKKYIDLGSQPIANRLLTEPDQPAAQYPLGVQKCQDCGMSMLTYMVSSTEVYKDYPFLSGTSKQWVKHCKELAAKIKCPEGPWATVVDIGSNDGTMGKAFQRKGWAVYGVEPNQPEGTEMSFPVKPVYWGLEEGDRARHYLSTNTVVQPDLVIATNVFGHTPDPLDFLRGIKKCLRPSGVAVIECQHVGLMQQHFAFDTIYHEHLWFWSTKPMMEACRRTGLMVANVEYFPNLHTGSVRYWLRNEGYTGTKIRRAHPTRTKFEPELERVEECLANEATVLGGMEPYHEFGAVAVNTIDEFRRLFSQGNKTVFAGYGASAKCATLLNTIKATPEEIPCIVDDAITKQGKFMPGSKIPIVPEIPEETEVLILFSWNVAVGLMRKALGAGYTGMFLVPLPVMKVYDAEEAATYIRSTLRSESIEKRREFIYA